MKTIYLLILTLLVTSVSKAQDCSCEKNFLWMKKTFEENDAGFAYVLRKKGNEAYQMYNLAYLEKVKNINDERECGKLLNQWARFFRQGHIGVNYKGSQNTQIVSEGKTLPLFKFEVSDFKRYLDKGKEPAYEGIWYAEPFKIAIRKEGQAYLGLVIETSAANWQVGELKTRFDGSGGVYYPRNKTEQKISAEGVRLIGNNNLLLGNVLLKRIYPVLQEKPGVELEMKLQTSTKPFLERFNASTLVLRIPSFEISEKKYIDSVINVNKAIIASTPSLIIDVRGNGGGSDESFKAILPILYTNPIRTVGVEFLSTKLNNQRMLELSKNMDFGESSRKQFKRYYDTLENSLGKFVSLSAQRVAIDSKDGIQRYPKQIGILIDQGNGSTTEQFLLAAKQSKKVKLFGETTFGMLDISNVNIIDFPCGKYELYYGLSKSYRVPGMAVDDIGLQPDFYIDGTVSRSDWVKFTEQILNNNVGTLN